MISQSAIKIINKKALEHKLLNFISTKIFDVREKLPFEDCSIEACFSHMLYCMALTESDLEELNKKIHNLSNFKLIIVFGNIINGVRINKDAILAPSINELGLKKNLKKNLWVEIKTKLDI